jgi:rSAM/selenodomain-associated transferase 1
MEKSQDLAGWTLPVRSLRKRIATDNAKNEKGRRAVDPNSAAKKFSGCSALALMTKAPRAGEVKTRLVPPLTNEEAAQLNRCFLQDTAAAISVCCDGVVAPNCGRSIAHGIAVYTPVGAESDYADILPDDFSLLPQRGKDFGERLYFAAEDLFKSGFKAVCLIDSDSPTIPHENFTRALQLLSLPGDRMVLGSCDDGGYYLIGLKRLHREVFERIDWSTERVFEQTRQRAAQIGVEVHELPRGFDVDDRAALHRLCDELLGENARDGVAPRTQEFLRELIARDGRKRIWSL